MIASFSNGFIFIKTPKTGGTSAEIVMSTWLSGDDFCTRISKPDEVIRKEYGGWPPSRHYKGTKIYNHMPAVEVRDLLGDFWDKAFTFAAERHPYEKAVSLAYHAATQALGRPPGDAEFAEVLEETISDCGYLGRERYTDGGRVIVDEVIRHDRFWPRLAELADGWGQRLPDTLPRAKGTFRLNTAPARTILTDDQMRRIRADAAFEFQLLDFEP